MKRSELMELIKQMPGVNVKFFLCGDSVEMRMESITLYIDDGRTVINFRKKDPQKLLWTMKRRELMELIMGMPGGSEDEVKFYLSGYPEELTLESMTHYLEKGCMVMDFRQKRDKECI